MEEVCAITPATTLANKIELQRVEFPAGQEILRCEILPADCLALSELVNNSWCLEQGMRHTVVHSDIHQRSIPIPLPSYSWQNRVEDKGPFIGENVQP